MASPITVLVIDDSATVRATTRDLLLAEGDIVVVEASDGLGGIRMLVDKRPDLVLCDLEMPLADGRKFLALVRGNAELREVPVIMLTADDDADRKADLLDLGAADYVTKPFHPRELLSRVRVQLRLCRLTAALRAANERLTEIAVTDALTGLPNRRWLDETLAVEIARTKRYGFALSLAIVDVDRFKSINDRFGHDGGDVVLCGLARTFRTGVRRTDLTARLGGEEFVVLMPHTALDVARDVAERLRASFAKTSHELGQDTVACTVSIGVAAFDATRGIADATRLLKSADEALYRAKAEGRDRVVG